jgi:RNA polymerase-binding transcription factor DksA
MEKFKPFFNELQRERERLVSMLEARRASAKTHGSSSVQDAFSNSGDSEFSDGASDLYEQELDVSMVGKYKHRLRSIEEALARFDQGTYGTCVRCHQSILRARLEAIPETPFCFGCESDVEVQG